jgi:hypothetical protein
MRLSELFGALSKRGFRSLSDLRDVRELRHLDDRLLERAAAVVVA